MADESDDDEVGYARPPKAHQFKKGQSGNPGGRPKGARNFKSIASELMAEPVRVRGPDGMREISSVEAMLRVAMKKALQGDLKFIEMFQRATAERDSQDPANTPLPLSEKEYALYQQILNDEQD